MPRPVVLVPVVLILGVAAWWGIDRGSFGRPANGVTQRTPRAAPVEVAAVERGKIVDRREFSGTLVARAKFVVAPKVSGRIESLQVDIGDEVKPDDIVARLDDDEFQQAVVEAQAELAVRRAQVLLARAALDVAESNAKRTTDLQQRGIASDTEFDVANADLRARRAGVDVALAQVQRAEAALEGARVRLRYTTVVATWSRTGAPRVVSRRYLDAGATVAANAPIVTVVDLSSVRAQLFVTERDFARLAVGQAAQVRNDAYPGQVFAGRVLRVAPVFEEASRQTRLEIEIPNPDRKLRPGMFVRVEITLGSTDDAVIVPEAALVRRDDGQGLFVVQPAGDTVKFDTVKFDTVKFDTVKFVTVRVGITAGRRVEVFGEGITGKVVILGQQLLEDGARIRVPGPLNDRPGLPSGG